MTGQVFHALLLGVAVLTLGCQSTQQTLAKLPGLGDTFAQPIPAEGKLPPPASRTWPEPQQDVLNQRVRNYGLASMPLLQVYLDGLLARVKSAAGVPDWPGAVYIVATPALDAYSTAAGNIYISPSWVRLAESEDELVALISHEFAHIYLHYHLLESTVDGTNQAAQVAQLALLLAKRQAMARVWTPVDTLAVGYAAGRDMAIGYYGRGEEIAADSFALNVSLSLGYSYENGIKPFLERVATWEESNARQRKLQREQLRAELEKQARENAAKGNEAGKQSEAAKQAAADLGAGMNTAMFDLQQAMSDTAELVNSRHPDPGARIAYQARSSEKLPAAKLSKDPLMAAFNAARLQPATAKALANYQLASQVLENVAAPGALDKAMKAASAPTANQAMPLIALFRAQQAADTLPQAKKVKRGDPGKLLERNFNSPIDRAWRTYFDRALQLQQRGEAQLAKKTIDSGFSIFRSAPETWPQAIPFYGETQGWKIAKEMSSDCAREHRLMADACREAAISPAEKAEAERQSAEKGKRLAEQVMSKAK